VSRLVLALLLGALIAPASAGAQTVTQPASPIEALAPAEQVPAHRPIAFRVRTTAPAGAVVVRVSGSPRLTPSGLLDISDGRGIDLATKEGNAPEVHIAQTPGSTLRRTRTSRSARSRR
jgi:hypothetical protein